MQAKDFSQEDAAALVSTGLETIRPKDVDVSTSWIHPEFGGIFGFSVLHDDGSESHWLGLVNRDPNNGE